MHYALYSVFGRRVLLVSIESRQDEGGREGVGEGSIAVFVYLLGMIWYRLIFLSEAMFRCFSSTRTLPATHQEVGGLGL